MPSIGPGAASRSLTTILLEAAKENDKAKLESLISTVDNTGENPGGADFDLEAKDEKGRTALHWAAAWGNETLLRYLLGESGTRKADVQASGHRGKTALHLASAHGHTRIVRLLLNHNANCKATSHGEWTAMHMAAEQGHKEVVRELIHSKAEVNAATTRGRTPLHWASLNGHIEVVEILLRQADIKRYLQDDLGYSPLMLAGQNRHTAIVQLLAYDGSELPRIGIRACEEHRALITDFFPKKTSRDKYAIFHKPSIFDLLYRLGEESKKPTVLEAAKEKLAFKWIHLPANNVSLRTPRSEYSLTQQGARWLGWR
jgi:hypothetical protein